MEIQTEKFSGPFGLLLSLIESEELDITEISLAKIADDYVAYIKEAKDIGAEEMADFLVIAAKLLLIKSKALLPYLYTKEDDDEVNDLERQLKMYKEFIEASVKIKAKILEGKKLYLPPLNKSFRLQGKAPSFSPPKKLTKEILRDKLAEILLVLEKELEKREREKLPVESLEPKISIDEKIFSIRALLAQKLKLSFSRILKEAKSRTEVIVSFLAVLELAKQKELYFEQGDLFSEIMININNIHEEEDNDEYSLTLDDK
ncbi:segregation/condensation protein A [Candidatus Falkowbacteria bacterium]|nr:segregation/condensation protein A [Candidatus Falkowbacteria bacterium]NCT54883.1 segregation/condensation protein A [Candidatus Falkowbacteria bacterium]